MSFLLGPAPPAAAAASSSSSASGSASLLAPPSSSSLGLHLKRSASGQSLDALSARRCWSRLDQGSSGFVGAPELLQYLQRFVAQQTNAAKEAQRRKQIDEAHEFGLASAPSAAPGGPMHDDGEEEHKSGGGPSSAAAASASSARFAGGRGGASSSSRSADNGLSARAAALVSQASSVTLRDLEDVLSFADANGDGKLDLEELLAALQCFSNPPVTLCTGRFESAITTRGLDAARPKPPPPQQIVVPLASAASSSPAQSNAATNGASSSSSPSIFLAASLPLPSGDAASNASSSEQPAAAAAAAPGADVAAGAAAAAAPDADNTQPMEQDP